MMSPLATPTSASPAGDMMMSPDLSWTFVVSAPALARAWPEIERASDGSLRVTATGLDGPVAFITVELVTPASGAHLLLSLGPLSVRRALDGAMAHIDVDDPTGGRLLSLSQEWRTGRVVYLRSDIAARLGLAGGTYDPPAPSPMVQVQTHGAA